jgi:glycyl-tRNA synthetase beta chain
MKPLLIEIGTEELPPKALDELTDAFAKGVCDGLAKRGIAADAANAKKYNSPRRLAVLVPSVGAAQPDQAIERRGPAVNAGLDANGQPTKALSGFAASCGVAVEELEKLQTDKGAWFVHRAQQKGKPTAALLQDIIAEALAGLPIPKPMRWGDHDFAFVRPAHWLVVLHGDEVATVELFGIKSGRSSRGHRFLSPSAFDVAADSYETSLRDVHFVIADPVSRRNRVSAVVEQAVAKLALSVSPRADLVAEIANLVEWPAPSTANFSKCRKKR